MKPFQHLKLILSFIIATLFFTHTHSFAQDSTLQKSILVYILSDSLELPALEKENVPYTKAIVKSKSLLTALNIIKPAAISKAFPDWNAADSIKTNDLGITVKAPQFDRVFTFTFDNIQQADNAIILLKSSFRFYMLKKICLPNCFRIRDLTMARNGICVTMEDWEV